MCKNTLATKDGKPTASICRFGCDQIFNGKPCEHSLAEFDHDPVFDTTPSSKAKGPTSKEAIENMQKHIEELSAKAGWTPSVDQNFLSKKIRFTAHGTIETLNN